MKEIFRKINWKKLWASISYVFFLLFLLFLELSTIAYFHIEYGQISAIAFGLLTFVLNLYFFVDIKAFRIKKKQLGIDTEINSFLPFIIIGAPIAVNAFLLFIFYDPSMKDTSGFIVGTDKDWLSFFGALLGGVITMIAVSYTIRNENENRRNDTAIQQIPLLKMDFHNEKFSRVKIPIYYYGEEENFKIVIDFSTTKIPVTIRNISGNIASKIKVSKLHLSILEQFDPEDPPSWIDQSVETTDVNRKLLNKIIPGNYAFDIELPITGISFDSLLVYYSCELDYYDYLGVIEHRVVSSGYLELKFDENEICLAPNDLESEFIK